MAYITARDGKPARLHVHTPGRTPASYATAQRHGSVFLDCPHLEAAIAHAERHWSESLTLDHWSAYAEDFLLDPSTPFRSPGHPHDGHPRRVGTLYLALPRSVQDIEQADTMPASAGYDEAVEATMDPLIGRELRGGRGTWNRFHCALCGSGLGLERCVACGLAFHEYVCRCGTSEPLGPKLVEVAQAAGLTFRTDPVHAQATERAAWEQGR